MAEKPRSRAGAAAQPTFLNPTTNVQHEGQRRVLDAISKQRANRAWSASKAAREAGTTVPTMLRYAPGAFEVRGGRYRQPLNS